MTSLLVTGHRPNRLGGYSGAANRWLGAFAADQIRAIRPHRAVIGMAQGWDQACARACQSLGIPYTAVIPGLAPGLSFGDNWPQRAQDEYLSLLEAADDIIWCPWPGHDREYYARDERMVHMVREMPDPFCLALWNGERSGTGITVGLAHEWGVPVWNCWKEWQS